MEGIFASLQSVLSEQILGFFGQIIEQLLGGFLGQ
jgi:hypothetical protein